MFFAVSFRQNLKVGQSLHFFVWNYLNCCIFYDRTGLSFFLLELRKIEHFVFTIFKVLTSSQKNIVISSEATSLSCTYCFQLVK